MAADLSRPAATPVYSKAPIVSSFSWTDFYLGVDGGYGYAFANFPLGRMEYRYTNSGTVRPMRTLQAAHLELGNKMTINDIRAGLGIKFGGGYQVVNAVTRRGSKLQTNCGPFLAKFS